MSDKLLYFKIKHVNIIKTITEILNNMLSEIVWTFTNNDINDPNKFVGLEMSSTDPSKTIYSKIKLNKELFSSYICKNDKIELGINLENLHKILKLVDKNTSLYFYVLENNKDNLIIKIKNKDKKNETIYELKLNEVHKQTKKINKINFDKNIDIPSDEFMKLCKEMNSIAEYITINCNSNNIIFSCKGTCANRTSTYHFGEDDIFLLEESNNTIVNGTFELKNIVIFSKCSDISTSFTIFLKTDFALTIQFILDNFGSFTIAFSPIKEENIKNISYSYSDDEDDLDIINNGTNILHEL